MTLTTPTIEEVEPTLAAFGKRHLAIRKLEVFGSVAGGNASPESDLDLLVTFGDEIPAGLRYAVFFTDLVEELESTFGRKVDLVDRKALRSDLFGFNAVQHLKTVYERL